ncbi:undecaprenyl-diphosphatase UppP [Chloroflexota bacterium]
MSIIQSILLGIIQGLTEFLPVSSSGHLVIIPYLFGWEIPPQDAFIFDVLVQVATLVAVFAYFWKDLVTIGRAWLAGLFQGKPFADPNSRLGWLLILATIPSGIIGLLLKNAVEAAFASPAAAGFFLLVTAGLLIVAERSSNAEKDGEREHKMTGLSWLDALLIGLSQALAIFPGVSRSGATITGGMTRGLQRPAAARFSFLMSVPIMLAAGLLAGLDLAVTPHLAQLLPTFIPGFLAAAVVGYLSIRWLLAYLTRRPLYGFAVYCAGLGLLTLVLSLSGH